MKRDDIKTLFPEATAEQIDQLMTMNGNDVNNARKGTADLEAAKKALETELQELKANAEQWETDKQTLTTVQQELEEIKAANALRDMRDRVSKATGVPASLLTGETEEDCTEYAKQLLEFKTPSAYPRVPDGGEPGGNVKADTRTQFAEWFTNQM